MKIVTMKTLEERKNYLLTHMTHHEKKVFDILYTLECPVYPQHIVFPYICDFVGYDRNFIIEVDGNSHMDRDEYDGKRDKYLTYYGFTVYRISNEDINETYIKDIIAENRYFGATFINTLLTIVNKQLKPYGNQRHKFA